MPKARKSAVICSLDAVQHAETLKRLNAAQVGTNAKGCKLLNMAPSKENGYIQLFVAGTTSKVLAHVLSCFDEFSAIKDEWREDFDVSHLCGNPNCVKKSHLRYEHKTINQRRKGCKATVSCPCPCGHTFNICTCDPNPENKCI